MGLQSLWGREGNLHRKPRGARQTAEGSVGQQRLNANNSKQVKPAGGVWEKLQAALSPVGKVISN